jgi:hypothetical protein
MPPTFLLSFFFENPAAGVKAQARSKIAKHRRRRNITGR